jgi:hypothetical protein
LVSELANAPNIRACESGGKLLHVSPQRMQSCLAFGERRASVNGGQRCSRHTRRPLSCLSEGSDGSGCSRL